MKPQRMLTRFRTPLTAIHVALLLVLFWIGHFHNAELRSHLPSWGWVQSAASILASSGGSVPEEDEDPDNTKNEIPVHTAKLTRATVHRYIDGIGVVSPRPSRSGEPAGAANLASPVAGVVAKVFCQAGQQVKAGQPLLQLDDRLAIAALAQSEAGVRQAEASLATLRATPRPEQLQIAQLSVEKSQAALDFAQKTFDRLKQLAADQGTSGKSVEQSAMDLASAKSDLAISQRQLALLKSSPTPEELQQEESKLAQAMASANAATVQKQLMTLTSPVDATVMAINVNPGEAVDNTHTLVQLVALDRLVVNVDLLSRDLPSNTDGLDAQLTPDVMPSGPGQQPDPIAGKVLMVAPQVNVASNSVTLMIEPASNSALRPGQTVHVRITAETHPDSLVAPKEAVVSDENGDSVISIVEGTQATHKTVRIGFQDEGQIEILSDNLKEGMTIVTAGAFGLPAASRVKILD